MDAILLPETLVVVGVRPAIGSGSSSSSPLFHHRMPCPLLLYQPGRKPLPVSAFGSRFDSISGLRKSSPLAAAGTLMANSVPVCCLTLSAILSLCLPELNAQHTMELHRHAMDTFYLTLFYSFEVFRFIVYYQLSLLLLILLNRVEF